MHGFLLAHLLNSWLETCLSLRQPALLSPQISTRGIHKSYADFLQPDSASQSVQTTRQTLSSSNSSPEQGCSSRTGTGSSRTAGSEQESVQVEISWFFKKREGLFSTLTIQWLDIPSLHSETIQWGVLVLPCAIYRIQETVVKLLEMLEHGITCHELHHCPFLHLGWQRRGVLNKKKRVNSVTFLRLGKEAEGAELSKHLPWRTANNVFV